MPAMLLLLALAAQVASSASAPAHAPAGSAAAPRSAAYASAADDKVTCQNIARTGSMIDHMVCHTATDWRRLTDDSQDTLRRNSGVATPSYPAGH